MKQVLQTLQKVLGWARWIIPSRSTRLFTLAAGAVGVFTIDSHTASMWAQTGQLFASVGLVVAFSYYLKKWYRDKREDEYAMKTVAFEDLANQFRNVIDEATGWPNDTVDAMTEQLMAIVKREL